MFFLFFLAAFGGSFALSSARGAREGLWVSWPLALFLLPVWLVLKTGAFLVDLRTGAIAGALLGFLIHPPQTLPNRPVVSDGIVGFLVAAQVVSESLVGQFGKFTILEIARGWLLPYLVGRLYIGSNDDVRGAVRSLSKACLIISGFATFEAITKFHPVNEVLGRTYGLLEQGEGYRMGMKRAQGMTDHPIFFGMLLVLILPYAIEASRQARLGEAAGWRRLVPWALGAALFGSVSRGPQLSGLIAVYVSKFFYHPRLRVALLVLAVAGGVGAVFVKEVLIERLQAMAGENEETPRIIMIDGEPEEYTGTRHRILLFKVYARALETTGWFGWGQRMQGIELEEHLANRFGSIDSHYIMFYLQRGYTGIVPFVMLELWTLFILARAAWPGKGPRAGLAGPMFGAMAAVDLGFFSVWFSPDFGTAWLFNTGVAATLATLPVDAGRGATTLAPRSVAASPRRPPRLAPGHAPIRPLNLERP